jgi:hypothetical protein
MTKVEFTNWLHTEFDAVFHGDITPEQVMLKAIPMIDLFVSKNCGKPIVSGSLPFSEVKSKILAGNAKSEYKQASIVMLRYIYSEAGAMTD